MRGFEIYAQANAINKTKDRLNWLLHYAGPKVQDVFYTLPDKTESMQRGPLAGGYVFAANEYTVAVKKLNEFFEPKQNVLYERHVFRQLKQKNGERFDMFLMRLREQADRCNFGNQTDDNLRDQITSGCSSDVLRRKTLEKEDASLEKIVKMAQILEVVAKQQQSYGKGTERNGNGSNAPIETNESKDESVCRIENKSKSNARKSFAPRNFDSGCGRSQMATKHLMKNAQLVARLAMHVVARITSPESASVVTMETKIIGS